MEIQIVGHHGGAEDSNRDVKHFAVGHDFRLWQEAGEDATEVRLGKNNLKQKTATDGQNEDDHERFDVTKAFVLQIKHRQHVERSDANTDNQRDVEKQIQRDRRADNFRQVAGTDR